MPLLGMAPDEVLELAQHLLRGPDLVPPWIAGVLCEDQRRALGLVGVVRQPVDANRKDRSTRTQRDGGRPKRNRRKPAEEGHRVAGADDVAVDCRDYHLLVAQGLENPAKTPGVERQDADSEPGPGVAIPLEQGSRFQLLREEADRRERRRPDR